MPLYRFTAVNSVGKTVVGRCEASSEAALSGILQRRGQWLASARAVRETADKHVVSKVDPHVSRRILANFFLTLGLQIRAGVNVLSALTFVLDARAPAAFRAVHSQLMEKVTSGIPLSDAMAAHPRTFPSLAVHLVRAGEASGRLGEVCEEIRNQYEWSDRMASEVRQALIYPVTLIVSIIVFFFLAFTFFIPRFTGVLQELGVKLPWLTRVLIVVSDFVSTHYVGVLLGLLLPVAAFIVGVRMSPAFRRAVDIARLRIPLVGPILWQTSLARLVQNLAVLYRSGVPLLDALALCQPLVGNRAVEESVEAIREGVRAGRPLHDTMAQSRFFPPMLVQMTALGENTGTLDQSLQSVADYYNVMVPRAVKQLFSLFQPLVLLGLVMVVGTIVMSIFLPIASALEAR